MIPEALIQLKVALNVMKRKSFLHVSHRYKLLVGIAVCFLFGWMSIGSLKTERHHHSIPHFEPVKPKADSLLGPVKAGGKVREYPDFDYKYDTKNKKFPFRPPLVDDNNEALDEEAEEERKIQEIRDRLRKIKDQDMKLLKAHDENDDTRRLPSHDLNPSNDGDHDLPAHRSAQPLNLKASNNNVRVNRNKVNGIGVSGGDMLDHFDVVGSADLGRREVLDPAYDEFAEDAAKIVPGLGEGGEPVHLKGREAEEAKRVMEKEAFNLVASDKISLHRSVPDTRDPQCAAVSYPRELPTTSVVIIFTNEAWTPLLRTIWSVLDQTPDHLLQEIILVDDFSDKSYLKGKLDRYIRKKLPSKVRLKRLPKRSGLIRARLTGAELATGDVLVFLDSHCECGKDWLEPLVARIKEEPKAFVVPIIDVIDDKTMEYYHGNGNYFQIGGFTWGGHFNWGDIPDHEMKRRGSNIAPTRTPTMAGGLFAVDRMTFWEFGSYDEEMDVWGGENLEMSFRVWQCGGVLETIPCSRVGHIFRSFHPYTFPGNKDTHGINTARTVEVWMDDYKRLFYMNRPDLLSIEIGSVEKRNEFKKEMKCKSFKWYLDNIYPQKFILDDPDHAFAYGRVRNPTSNYCFDTLQNDEKDSYDLGVYPCHDYVAASQFFSFSKKYELRREDNCAEVNLVGNGGREPIKMAACTGSEDQEWIHTKQGRLIHKSTNKCLDVGLRTANEETLYAAPCKAIESQIFYFDNYIS